MSDTATKSNQKWPCPSCRGTGKIKYTVGVHTFEVACFVCKGTGAKKQGKRS